MGVHAGPDISTSGLVLSLDTKNSKSYFTIPGPQDHGISDWYCFESCTAVYSAIYPGTEIIEIDANGNQVGIVTTSSIAPQRGTFTAIGGRRYYGTKAIHLLGWDGGSQHRVVPVSFAGTSFANIMPSARGVIQTYHAYSPQQNATISFYNNSSTGINGIATATSVVSQGSTVSFASTSQNTWQFFLSNQPIVMSVGGDGWDRSILGPATNYSYNRFINNYISVTSSGTYTASGGVVYSNTGQLVVNQTIADGSGGDQAHGIGTAWMSDTYSWGGALSDYSITAPYPNTAVNVSYYSSGRWNLLESHSLNGSLTSPAVQARDGNTGVGIAATYINGLANNFASGANLWKFEGNNPFALFLNDDYDDEELILGWMNNNYLRNSSNVNQSFVNLVDADNRRFRPSIYGKTFESLSSSDYFEFDGINDYINCGNISISTGKITVNAWVNINSSKNQHVVDSSNNSWHLAILSDNTPYFWNGSTYHTTGNKLTNGVWCMLTGVQGTSLDIYLNGVLNSTIATNVDIPTNNINLGRWQTDNLRLFDGKISQVFIYNRVLTAAEIQQNYNATKSRFGL